MAKRVFLMVLDSFGIGALPDAHRFGDEGSNTLGAVCTSDALHIPNMARLGLFHIDGISCREGAGCPLGAYARLAQASDGKDTTTGHWELAGLISETAMPTYPQGFPPEIIDEFSRRTGRGVLCNKPYSGTDLIRDFGAEHVATGKLLVYTSADSVFQIAAHEDVVPLGDLYRYCEIAREILTDEHAVGRVIARPFTGVHPHFTRTANRRDFSLHPPRPTLLDYVRGAGLQTIAVGKIYDIFAGSAISESIQTHSNAEGMEATASLLSRDFKGLAFINLVDFDMLYGHRNDVDGYARALTEFDLWLGGFLDALHKDDLLLITADHGCDPSTPSTDHSREYVPLLIYGAAVRAGENLGTGRSFADVAATVAGMLDIPYAGQGESLAGRALRYDG